jgi:hypothetical protein
MYSPLIYVFRHLRNGLSTVDQFGCSSSMTGIRPIQSEIWYRWSTGDGNGNREVLGTAYRQRKRIIVEYERWEGHVYTLPCSNVYLLGAILIRNCLFGNGHRQIKALQHYTWPSMMTWRWGEWLRGGVKQPKGESAGCTKKPRGSKSKNSEH